MQQRKTIVVIIWLQANKIIFEDLRYFSCKRVSGHFLALFFFVTCFFRLFHKRQKYASQKKVSMSTNFLLFLQIWKHKVRISTKKTWFQLPTYIVQYVYQYQVVKVISHITEVTEGDGWSILVIWFDCYWYTHCRSSNHDQSTYINPTVPSLNFNIKLCMFCAKSHSKPN